MFNKLKGDPDIRFEVKKVEKTADKVFLLVQVSCIPLPRKLDIHLTFLPKAVLGGVSWSEYKVTESQPQMEAHSVFRHIARISRGAKQVFEFFIATF